MAYDEVNQTAKDVISVYVKNLKLTLQAERIQEETGSGGNEYGKIDLTVKDYEYYGQIEKYIFYRKEADKSSIMVKEISASELEDGRFTFNDKYLEPEKEYTYVAKAVASDGRIIGISNEVTI